MRVKNHFVSILSFLFLLIIVISGCKPLTTNSNSTEEVDNFGSQNESTPPRLPTTQTIVVDRTQSATQQPTGPVDNSYIYFWNFPDPYGRVRFTGEIDRTELMIPSKDIEVSSPGVDLSFSNHSDKVAFLSRNGRLTLWFSDMNLSHVKKIWEDTDFWFGEKASYENVDIIWGPGDRFLIIESASDKKLLVYDLTNKESYFWEGFCNGLDISTSSSQLTLRCNIFIDGVKGTAILDKAVGITISTDISTPSFEAEAWNCPASGDVCLISDSEHRVWIIGSKVIELPILYEKPSVYDFKGGLKWSNDKKYIIVYGSPKRKDICPPIRNLGTGEGTLTRPCWIVFDSTSGEMVWWPITFSSNPETVLIEDLVFLDASLSPDNKQIAISVNVVGLESPFILVEWLDQSNRKLFPSMFNIRSIWWTTR